MCGFLEGLPDVVIATAIVVVGDVESLKANGLGSRSASYRVMDNAVVEVERKWRGDVHHFAD
jgi:hypothetical protein